MLIKRPYSNYEWVVQTIKCQIDRGNQPGQVHRSHQPGRVVKAGEQGEKNEEEREKEALAEVLSRVPITGHRVAILDIDAMSQELERVRKIVAEVSR